jgi:hypothetical protein
MTPAGLLAELRGRGVRLEAVGDRLRVDAPAGVLTTAERAAIQAQKPALIALVRESDAHDVAAIALARESDGDGPQTSFLTDTTGLSANLAGLVRPRDGWTPKAWRDNLLRMAACCESLVPERAAELRQAAELMLKSSAAI